MNDISVDDLRPNGDPSLTMVPRIQNFETLQNIFHVQVDRSRGWDRTPPGQACWKLIGFELRPGPAEYKLKVRQESGQAHPNILVYRHRPGAPELPGEVNPPYFRQGEGNFTNAFGEIVFGNASVAGPDGGSDTIWVSASPPGQQPQFSDAATKLGRHSAIDLVPNPIFQLAIKQTSTPSQDDNYTLSIVANGQEVGHLTFGQAEVGNNYVILRRGDTELGRLPWQPAT